MPKMMNLSEPKDYGKDRIYFIKNKDKTIGAFTWEAPGEFDLQMSSWWAKELPLFIRYGLKYWIDSRIDAFPSVGDPILFNRCLSVYDSLWVTIDQNETWSGVNLRSHDFNPYITDLCFKGKFGGGETPVSKNLLAQSYSPEYCHYPACDHGFWVKNQSGEIEHYSPAWGCPWYEVMISQILDTLGYNHVEKKMRIFRGKSFSKFKLFTTENLMFIPWNLYFQMQHYDNCVPDFLQLAKDNGVEKDLARLYVLDYLIGGSVRSAASFGLMLDSDTFEVKSLAPAFDSADCVILRLFLGTANFDWTGRTQALNSIKKMVKKILGEDHNVQNLLGFSFNKAELVGCPDALVEIVERFLQVRVKEFLGKTKLHSSISDILNEVRG